MNHVRFHWPKFVLWALALASAASIAVNALAQSSDDADDVIAKLGKQLSAGETTLEYRDGFGYLPSLLEHLNLKIDSQVLVFSKTSFQQRLITPKNPRALYFNDTVSVGTVPGGEVYEIAAIEPSHGIAFYTLDTAKSERPQFKRRGVECLFCHAPGNRGAPALVVASVVPGPDGTPAYTGGFIDTIDDRTPFDQRWGGWYVTGTHGSQRHMGNAFAPDPDHPLDLQQTGTQNVVSLADRLDVSKYLTGTSDIVALMTLEHQVGAINRINALSFQYRLAERKGLVTDADWKSLDELVDDLVRYITFVDEAPLAEPVKGVSTFAQTFAERGPRDKQGRSLRDFDLKTRLFRYPLSYVVYNEIFDAMPTPVRDRVYTRLHAVLTGQDTSKDFASIPAADRQATLEILRETKPNLNW